MLIGKPSHTPELVIGLVSPIGTELSGVAVALQAALKSVDYASDVIRLSELLADSPVPGTDSLPGRDDPNYYSAHMDAGDNLRRAFASSDVLAAYTVRRIRGTRKELTGGSENQQRRYASILHSLKHDEEVKLLRATYRSRFILIGVSASLEQRTANLEAKLADQGAQFSQGSGSATEVAASLLHRDEEDPRNEFGQHVSKTFSMADAFLWQSSDAESIKHQTTRLIELLFARPFLTPSKDELAMFHARAAALRSADAGRQVGVAIANPAGDILVTGTNDVPKPGGGQYWQNDPGDSRDFRKLRDTNKRLTRRLIADVLERLKTDKWLAPRFDQHTREQLLDAALARQSADTEEGPLEGARITDLLEFSRVVHAEMGAICEAASRGVPIAGSTLYTTTYPCHLCARLVIASGIARVVYIDPYGKSVVPELFGDQITVANVEDPTAPAPDRVLFNSFTGVAPSMFATLFTATGRKPDPTGHYPEWKPSTALPRTAQYETLADANVLESDVVDALRAREDDFISALDAARQQA